MPVAFYSEVLQVEGRVVWVHIISVYPGVRFDIRQVFSRIEFQMQRVPVDPCFSQRLLDAGVAISVVSVVMGHLSTRTTEQHYARVKHAVAVKEVVKTFEHMEDAPPEYNDSQRVR